MLLASEGITLAPLFRWIVLALVIGGVSAIVVTLLVAFGFVGLGSLARRLAHRAQPEPPERLEFPLS